MPRASQQETVTTAVQQYLALAEVRTAEEYPLEVRSVARTLHISPTTLYKYDLDHLIAAARQRQKNSALLSGEISEKQTHAMMIHELKADLEQERERNRGLVEKIVLMEANAARLGFDAEELYRPLLKPIRSSSSAGKSGQERRR